MKEAKQQTNKINMTNIVLKISKYIGILFLGIILFCGIILIVEPFLKQSGQKDIPDNFKFVEKQERIYCGDPSEINKNSSFEDGENNTIKYIDKDFGFETVYSEWSERTQRIINIKSCVSGGDKFINIGQAGNIKLRIKKYTLVQKILKIVSPKITIRMQLIKYGPNEFNFQDLFMEDIEVVENRYGLKFYKRGTLYHLDHNSVKNGDYMTISFGHNELGEVFIENFRFME